MNRDDCISEVMRDIASRNVGIDALLYKIYRIDVTTRRELASRIAESVCDSHTLFWLLLTLRSLPAESWSWVDPEINAALRRYGIENSDAMSKVLCEVDGFQKGANRVSLEDIGIHVKWWRRI